MSAQSTRPRGFSPLFRGISDQQMRVSDAERQAVVDRLAEHFGEGRLDHGEFDERVGLAMNAKIRADLAGLLDDLPATGAPAAPERAPRRRMPVLGLVLLVLIILAAAHAAIHAAALLLWAGLVAAIVLVATRGARARQGSRLSSCHSCRDKESDGRGGGPGGAGKDRRHRAAGQGP